MSTTPFKPIPNNEKFQCKYIVVYLSIHCSVFTGEFIISISSFLFMPLYYYNTKILLPVSGRRLVYKFGPTARGWSTQNPIFYPSYSCETDESDEDGIDHVSYQLDPIQFPTPMTYPELPV
uniref:Uncharacterized protein n=1 Tax=Heterorhabditis bacteriophora TaxID=37862 RepID=A0A1I7WT39_HETBA